MSEDQFNQILNRQLTAFANQLNKRLDERLITFEGKVNKQLDEQLANFAGCLNRRFDQLEAKINAKADRSQVERLHGAVDSLSGQVRDAATEGSARDNQLYRHDQAIIQIANRINLQLQYE